MSRRWSLVVACVLAGWAATERVALPSEAVIPTIDALSNDPCIIACAGAEARVGVCAATAGLCRHAMSCRGRN